MNNHLKSILKVCGIVGLICLVTVLSCLPFVNFDNNKAELYASELYTTDSQVYGFNSSRFLMPFCPVREDDLFTRLNGVSFMNFSVSIFNRTDYVDVSFVDYATYYNFVNIDTGNRESIDRQYSVEPIETNFNLPYDTWTRVNVDEFSGVQPYPLLSYFARLSFRVESGFIADVRYCVIEFWNDVWGNNRIGVQMSFFDSNGKRFIIQLPGTMEGSIWRDTFIAFIPSRTVYFDMNLSDSEIYQSGYASGFNDGNLQGSSDGYDLGYGQGYNAGRSLGYDQGYNDGLDEQDVYTFGNLLTAVIDAPVGVFISMLDFNIMGFNLLNLVVGLLTLAVICLVIKLMLGGK